MSLSAVILVAVGCSRSSDVTLKPRVEAPDQVLGVPNVDFNNQWERVLFDDNDAVPFEVDTNVAAVRVWRLTLGPGHRWHRVWIDEQILLDQQTETAQLPRTEGPLTLRVEFGDFDQSAVLTLEGLDAVGAVIASKDVELRSSPLLLNHHLQQSELVMAVAVDTYFENNDMMADYEQILGDAFVPVDGLSYGYDVWLQDEIELSTGTAPEGQRMNVVIDSIRNRGLDNMPEDVLRGEDFGVMTWGDGYATTYDSFGNLEVSPPIDGFPWGRIYYGSYPGSSPADPVLFEKLAAQAIQAPFTIDTSWLCVGHVDEIMSFVPDSTAPRGFRFVWGDVALAWEVLEAMDPSTPLPRYAGSANHNIDTVGQIVNDNGLRALNDELVERNLDPILAKMTDELDLLDEEIVRIPALFEEPRGCDSWVAALMPGMANLVVTADDSGPTRVFMADPYVRADIGDQDSDPFIAAVRDAMPAELELHFLNDWDAYHLALGEVHCGTNVVRTPGAEWW